jgi:NADP-dependent 3-hydroxy acid dehydrogenase YdfG
MLHDQVAVITGASSGIGAAVAAELRTAGMRLVLTARRADRLRSLADELGESRHVAGDICDQALPDRLLETALGEFGRCDVVFNGAGVMHAARVEDADIDLLCRMIRVNFEAATRVAYTALRHFKRENRGHLVNVSSILGTKVRDTAGVYAGTKYAIEALSESLRIELARTGVKVSVLEPGLVTTELQDHFKVHPRDALGIKHPLTPADVARATRYLLEQPDHVRIPVLMILPSEQPM